MIINNNTHGFYFSLASDHLQAAGPLQAVNREAEFNRPLTVLTLILTPVLKKACIVSSFNINFLMWEQKFDMSFIIKKGVPFPFENVIKKQFLFKP